MAAALGGFLRAADRLRGLLLTVAVEESVGAMSPDGLPEWEGKPVWKPDVYEHVVRVSHLVSLLVAGLSREGQDVAWCTDRDEIAATPPQQRMLAKHVARTHDLYRRHLMGGLTVKDNGNEPDMRWTDFLSVTDLAAGAFGKVLDCHQERIRSAGPSVRERFDLDGTKPKDRQILDWYVAKGRPLRRLFLMIDQNREEDSAARPHVIHRPDFDPPSRSIWAGCECVRRRPLSAPSSDRKSPRP
jgi:hypothetical protein